MFEIEQRELPQSALSIDSAFFLFCFRGMMASALT